MWRLLRGSKKISMKIIKEKYHIEKANQGRPYTLNVIESKSKHIVFTLKEEKVKRRRKLGCFFFLLSLFLGDGDIEFADSNRLAASKLLLTDKNGNQLTVNRIRKGVAILEKGKKIGSLKFRKRELVCKYEVKIGTEVIGKLIPNGIMHNELDIVHKDLTIAKFIKAENRNGGLGELEIYKTFSNRELKILLGAILFWI